MRVFNQTIHSIVDENFIYARALSHLGIEFYLHPHRRLGELCEEMGLVKEQVLKSFYLFDQNQRLSFSELNKFSLPIIIQYLRHTHHTFIKEKLPYVAELIRHLKGKDDLKLIFPEFVEEFIHHIYEEEDTVFGYIHQLVKIDRGMMKNPAGALWEARKLSLESMHQEHLEEDELAGIRDLIETYHDTDLHWQVIAKEIRAFDREMMYHAQIENKILFPKALQLELSVKEKIQKISQLN
ncbi:iron-sulfur cluster repair di-iron protein [Marinoscillum sp. MHG1-6]|uniref:iron-sulfur cluster repair di-iron protein n=1 Tax=Marinoscillum sp. MHG1-6 TaxID=2959627 RepID=UPI002157191D|nr:iron-sulfur cluster repair di-iron protein [Marinoscillum sp. MHG1-6]